MNDFTTKDGVKVATLPTGAVIVDGETHVNAKAVRALRQYFGQEHPEPKPWHSARPGDVWLLTFAGFEETGAAPWTVRPGRLSTDACEFIYPQNGNTIPLTDPEIVDAHRIWPEVTS